MNTILQENKIKCEMCNRVVSYFDTVDYNQTTKRLRDKEPLNSCIIICFKHWKKIYYKEEVYMDKFKKAEA